MVANESITDHRDFHNSFAICFVSEVKRSTHRPDGPHRRWIPEKSKALFFVYCDANLEHSEQEKSYDAFIVLIVTHHMNGDNTFLFNVTKI